MNFVAWYIIYTPSGLYTCKPSLKTTMHCILYWCDFFFFRRLAALQKRRELRAAGIE